MKKYGSYTIEKWDDGFEFPIDISTDSPTSNPTYIVFKNDQWLCECLDLDTAKQVVYGLRRFDNFVQFTGDRLQEFFAKRNEENKK